MTLSTRTLDGRQLIRRLLLSFKRLKHNQPQRHASRAIRATHQTVRVLFVCSANICRSPSAEGMFAQFLQQMGFADRIVVDSAGTHTYRPGAAPDPRAIRAAERRGVDIQNLRARQVQEEDFKNFHYLLVMDDDNYEDLIDMSPHPRYHQRVRLFMEFAEILDERVVPDPYYGGLQGFERVLDLIELANSGLLNHLIREAPLLEQPDR